MPQHETSLAEVLRRIAEVQDGFLAALDVAQLADCDRLRMVLVRCGAGRFTCAAQDVDHFCEIISRDGEDYVRDVSLLSVDPAFRGDYRMHTPAGSCAPSPAPLATAPQKSGHASRSYEPWDFGGAFDGVRVTSDADSGL